MPGPASSAGLRWFWHNDQWHLCQNPYDRRRTAMSDEVLEGYLRAARRSRGSSSLARWAAPCGQQWFGIPMDIDFNDAFNIDQICPRCRIAGLTALLGLVPEAGDQGNTDVGIDADDDSYLDDVEWIRGSY